MSPAVPSTLAPDREAAAAPHPKLSDEPTRPAPKGHRTLLVVFIVLPFLALLTAVPLAWGGWLGWTDVIITLVFYGISGHGVTIGYHRLFTHGSFKAKRWVRCTLAICGSLALEMSVLDWVADHRKHHKFSDKDGDPHSPWLYGESVAALTKGLFHAHIGWLFRTQRTSIDKYAPDLAKDPDMVRISNAFPYLVAVSLLLPAAVGGLVTWSWAGALTAFFWGSLVRVALLHHTTWSINSICHVVGDHPFKSRDRSGNVWWLAIPSMGESWHNLHHADPTSARHGALRGQLDTSARIIWLMEKFGWVYDVRWPTPERLAARRNSA